MSEKIISPGVFTREKDLSYIPKGIGEIGAVFVGRTEEGPAFVPTKISSYSDFDAIFGSKSDDMMVPYAVSEYLKSGNTATIVRVLSKGATFTYEPGVYDFIASGSSTVLATLRPT